MACYMVNFSSTLLILKRCLPYPEGPVWYPLFIKIYGIARMEEKLKSNDFSV